MFLDWLNIIYFDWYVVIEMLNVIVGLQEVYIMNVICFFLFNNSLGDVMINNIFVVIGIEGYNNYLMVVQNFMLGKIQLVIFFIKEIILGIDVFFGGGFLFRIWFNGEECVLLEMVLINVVCWLVVLLVFFMFVVGLIIFLFFLIGCD